MAGLVRTLIVVPVAIVLIVAAGCAARYGLVELGVQRDTVPQVRVVAEEMRSLAGPLGMAETSRTEMRGWFDPFCQIYAIPANRVSVVTRYQLPASPSADVLEAYLRALESRGWDLRRGVERGLTEGWRGRYRVQTTGESRPGGTLLVEVRNEDRTADGCFK
jgi:hypothetical protein